MKKAMLFITCSLFFGRASTVAQQKQEDSLRSMIVCRHWLIPKAEIVRTVDTNDSLLYLTYFFKTNDLKNPSNYGWGLMLDRNGTFRELFNVKCGMDRKQGSGTWLLQSDTLMLSYNRNRTGRSRYKIVRLTDKTLGLRSLSR